MVIRRASRTPAHDGSAFHHVGMAGRPMVGLHAAHRPAVDQRDLRNSELLDQQAALNRDRVVIADGRKRNIAGIRRRGRQAVTEQIRDDDEEAVGIEALPPVARAIHVSVCCALKDVG